MAGSESGRTRSTACAASATNRSGKIAVGRAKRSSRPSMTRACLLLCVYHSGVSRRDDASPRMPASPTNAMHQLHQLHQLRELSRQRLAIHLEITLNVASSVRKAECKLHRSDA